MMFLALFQEPLYFIAFVFAFIIGITVHEYAHALLAFRSGDPTAKLEGRLTLNPIAHLDPFGTFLIFLAGFGWGKPVPINPRLFRNKSDELKVALAGIIANILTAFIFSIPLRFAAIQGIELQSNPVLIIIEVIVELNVMLAAFNILPIPPLDGSHLVEYFLGPEAEETFQSIGPYMLIVLLVVNSQTHILSSIMTPIAKLLFFIVKGSVASLFFGG